MIFQREWDLYRFVQKIGGGVYKCVQVGGWVGGWDEVILGYLRILHFYLLVTVLFQEKINHNYN